MGLIVLSPPTIELASFYSTERLMPMALGASVCNCAPKPTRILTVDDHLRKRLAALINPESDLQLVAEVLNGEETIEAFRSYWPDVTLMDLQMPGLDGIQAISPICSEFPDVKLIVLTTYTGDVQVVSALRTSWTRSALFMLERREEEHLARFENELGKLDDLIERLLMLSRLESSTIHRRRISST